MKPPKSRKAELGSNATGGEKPHAETAESAEFKMTELGPIPVDWEVKRLGECCTRIKNGFTYSVCNRGSYKISRIETISKGVVNYSRVGYVKDAPPADYMLSNGDILFSHINSLPYIGNVALYDGKELLYHGMNLLLLRCNESANANYLYYALSSSPMRSKARELAKIAINQASISIGDLSRSEIPLPPLAEQRRIARALSDVDELISALGKLIEKKRNIKTGAMQQLLTGKTRLPGFKGKWVEKRLGECGYCFNGITGKLGSDFGHGVSRYITFLNVLSNVVINPLMFEAVDICSGESQNEVRRGDVFFNTSSETPEEVGLCAVLEDDVKSVYLNSFCFGFRLTDEDVCGRFLAYWFRSSTGRALMTSLAQGSTRYNLSKDAFREAYVCIPPTFAEQRAIATVLSDIDAEIAALEADRAKYESIKQGMMQELLTGRTRLKGE